MLVSTTSQYDTPDIAIIDHSRGNPQLWLRYFDIDQALQAVSDHIAGKCRSDKTPEQHTRKIYEAGLKYFLEWSQMAQPTEALMEAFIAHLMTGKKARKSSTVAAKYLAPVRLYLRKLEKQEIQCTGAVRDFVSDCRLHMRSAIEVKSPPPETTTNIAPLWDPTKTRLKVEQVNAVLRSIDTESLIGKRDYALLYIAFTSALRVAELSRITLNSITQSDDSYLITVRGKRSNYDPVPLSQRGYEVVMEWVSAYNAGLEDDDPRRITDKPIKKDGEAIKVNGEFVYMPIWQAMVHGDNYAKIGVNRFNPERGMSIQSIRNLIERRTEKIMGEGNGLEAHDTRRTAASIAHHHGMTLPAISKLLRHKDASVTWKYIGTPPNYKDSTLENYVEIG